MHDYPLSVLLVSELVGTALLILLGVGVSANTSLRKSFGYGRDWLLISFGWGFAVFVGASVAWRSGAQLNPAVTLGLAIAGSHEVELGAALHRRPTRGRHDRRAVGLLGVQETVRHPR